MRELSSTSSRISCDLVWLLLRDRPWRASSIRAASRHTWPAIRFATVATPSDDSEATAFDGLHAYLAHTYPRVNANLVRRVVDDRSLHYEWPGRDRSKTHVVLMAHLDVVPVIPGTEPQWTHAPWSGAIDSGFLYGRGALDDKSAVIAILEAVEQLLTDGFTPQRTFHLTFGGDEEIGGAHGAQQMVESLHVRGIGPALVLDEGGALVEGQVPGVAGRAAVIGIAEKGYLSLELSAQASGGHSSTPKMPTAIGRLCRAVAKLEARPFPPRIDGATLAMLRAIAPSQPFGFRVALANIGLFKPLIIRQFLADPKTATLVRTTTAPTMFHAGTTENLLPPEAKATVNFQILTGETTQSVIDRVRTVIDDSEVRVELVPSGFHSEPSSVSEVSGAAFGALSDAIRDTLGGPLVVPILTGPTDSRYWSVAGAKNVYRFTPFSYERDWMSRAHGTNERIAIRGLDDGVRFYMQLICNADAMER